MTEEDEGAADGIPPPASVLGRHRDPPLKDKYEGKGLFQTGTSVGTLMLWWNLPWFGSAAIMIVAVLAYFYYNDGPEESFNETVLGIIIGAAAVMGSSGKLSLILRDQ